MNAIERGLEAYSGWRNGLAGALRDMRGFLQKQDLMDPQVSARLERGLATLRDDRLYVAFVAEFSRGKSELINAIFFAGFGARVLPSSAGRTTMCPTELCYEAGSEPQVRLLPIETRAAGATVADLKGFPEDWTVMPINMTSVEQVAAAFSAIAATKEVSRDEAVRMGLHIAENETANGMQISADGKVEIPRWRHAVINFPHPMLEQGLVILDTPGLNAIGAEPELTLSMLPSAHAVLFILAADQGVTKSDIQVWHDHLGHAAGANGKGKLVVLNKIDGLWDGLREQTDIDAEISRQVQDTARHLGLPASAVYPVSAQKALAGKVKGDEALIARSRIRALESALTSELLPGKRDIVRAGVTVEVASIERAVRTLLTQRRDGVTEHMTELSGLNGKNVEVIAHMMDKVRADKEYFEKSLQRFLATRSVFTKQTNQLYAHLNIRHIDRLIAETRKNMETSLTTVGLKAGIQEFFAQVHNALYETSNQAQEIKALMDGVYRKFQEEHGLVNVRPPAYSVARYRREVKRIEEKQAQFLNGASLLIKDQRVVTRRFYESVAARIRTVFLAANRDADAWLKAIMSPMESQVREHQVQLRRRLESVKRIHQASDTLDDRLKELQQVRESIDEQERLVAARLDGLRAQLNANDESGQLTQLAAG